ncbi:DUF3858 domain-containing protein [Olleya aquimaris]|uniref:Transglutaminase superfamily protein n=1 Tax=Olleya aquimaris TaxID=639310 RepID=A0A327RLB5_9FLAO|nr:DUF3858 domain-containing protein [Olleya aquimaris]RAJ14527.1 transglutaminase superfamily protein [Olleya aquimaris]
MKKSLLLLTFALITIVSNAQDFKFGKVSKKELEEKVHPENPEVNAVVLFKKQRTTFPFSNSEGFTQETKVHERIKIYNKEGYNWATKKVGLYDENNSNSEKIMGLKGYTYKLVNGKIEKTKLKSESVFNEKTNKYWSTSTFTMPSLDEGCIVEFEYTIKSPSLGIDDVILQYDIPINVLEVEIVTPEYFNYNKVVNPRSSFIPNITESKKNRIEQVSSRERNSNRGGGLGIGGSYNTSSVNTSKFDFTENVVTILENNIPALVEEPFTGNIDNYRATIAFEYAFYKGPNMEVKNYSTTWDKVTETIYESDDFGGQLNKKNYFEEDVDALVTNASSSAEKTQLILDHVKSKVKWNDYLGFTTENGVKKAYNEGVGNVGDINLMLTAMLRHANINANPVLVSTRDNGVPFFPTRSGFNYVICAVEQEGKLVLLDATQQYSKPNILPLTAINWQGRLIREDGSSTWVNLNPNIVSKEIVFANVKLNDDLSAEGKTRRVLTNYQAYRYRNSNANKSNDNLVLNIEKDNPGLTVNNLEVKNAKLVTKPISQSYDYVFETSAEKIGDNIYISPLVFLGQEENPFTQESRNYPIDFICPIADKHTVVVAIPEGYQVETIPENTALDFNNGSASFSYLIKQTGNNIQLIVNLNINNTIIMPADYQNFKKFYQMMVEKNTEKIVLKKV